jgi:hypothetical protein
MTGARKVTGDTSAKVPPPARQRFNGGSGRRASGVINGGTMLGRTYSTRTMITFCH